MKKDMDLARRIRGDINLDFRDLNERDGNEVFHEIPNRNYKEGMRAL